MRVVQRDDHPKLLLAELRECLSLSLSESVYRSILRRVTEGVIFEEIREPKFPFEGERAKRATKTFRENFNEVSLSGISFNRRVLLLLFFFFELPRDISRVFFVRWFRRPFCEQVVYALVVLVIPSASDVSPVSKRHFRLVD